jgi:hypothetical protein
VCISRGGGPTGGLWCGAGRKHLLPRPLCCSGRAVDTRQHRHEALVTQDCRGCCLLAAHLGVGRRRRAAMNAPALLASSTHASTATLLRRTLSSTPALWDWLQRRRTSG